MHGTIDREVARIVRERMPDRHTVITTSIRRVRGGDGDRATILTMTNPMLTGTAYASPGMPDCVDGEELTDIGRRRVADAADDIARRHARQEVRVRIDQGADVRRPWLEDHNPPTWTLLSHPVMVHALMRAGANDLPVAGEQAFTVAPGTRIRRLQDLLIGECPLDPANPARGRVFCDDMGLVIEIADDIPHVARTALAGHPIGALVHLPACGDPSLDAEVEELMIASVDATAVGDAPGIMVTLSAATWRPCAPPPNRVNAVEMRHPPKIC